MVNEDSEDAEHCELIWLSGIFAEGKSFAARMVLLLSGHNPTFLKPDIKLCDYDCVI